MEKLVIKLSSTGLGYSGCIKKFNLACIEGYKGLMSASAVYGISVHKFIDTMYKTNENIRDATIAAKAAFNIFKEPPKKNQQHLADERHMLSVAITTWGGYVKEDSTFDVMMLNDKPATEQTFSIKLFEDDYIVVYFEGTIDCLGQIKGGCFAIRDWKTTSTWDTKEYFKRYEMSRQLRLYILACRLMAEQYPDSTLGRVGSTRMGAFIDAIFLKPDLADCSVKRSEVFQYSDSELNELHISLINYCFELSRRYKLNLLNEKQGILNGMCNWGGGLCQFWNVCKAPDNIAALLLERDFKKVVWNPLDYNNNKGE